MFAFLYLCLGFPFSFSVPGILAHHVAEVQQKLYTILVLNGYSIIRLCTKIECHLPVWASDHQNQLCPDQDQLAQIMHIAFNIL